MRSSSDFARRVLRSRSLAAAAAGCCASTLGSAHHCCARPPSCFAALLCSPLRYHPHPHPTYPPTHLRSPTRTDMIPDPTLKTVGRINTLASFVQYTDATFTRVVPKPAYFGLMGPTLRAEVGDTIRVHYRSRLSFDSNFHAYGLESLPSDNEVVPPGGEHVYEWTISAAMAPGPTDQSTYAFAYTSDVPTPARYWKPAWSAIPTGLLGMLVIGGKGSLDPVKGFAHEVDAEIPVLMEARDARNGLEISSSIMTQSFHNH